MKRRKTEHSLHLYGVQFTYGVNRKGIAELKIDSVYVCKN